MKKKLKGLLEGAKRNQLVSNYFWVFLGQNAGAVFSMLSLIITLRIISTFEYGALVVIQTYVTLISNLFCLRTFNGLIKYVTDAEITSRSVEVKKYIFTSFLLDFGAGIIAFLFGIVLLEPITVLMGWDANTVKFINLYLPVIIFLPLINGAPVGILRKLGYFKQVNIIHAIVFGIQTIVLFITYIVGIKNFQVILLEYALTETLECLVLLIYSLRIIQKNEKYKFFWKHGISKDYSFVKYSLYYGLNSTFDQILGNVSTLLINKYVGNLATAYIKVITRICSLFTKLSNPVSQIFYPELCEWITKGKYRKAMKVSLDYFKIICLAGIVILLVLFGTYDWWIMIFDPEMSSAKAQSFLYMIYTLLTISVVCINQLVFALNLVRENLIIVIISDILYLVLLIPFIIMWGIYGYLLLQIIQLLIVAIFKYLFIRNKICKLELLRSNI